MRWDHVFPKNNNKNKNNNEYIFLQWKHQWWGFALPQSRHFQRAHKQAAYLKTHQEQPELEDEGIYEASWVIPEQKG